MRVAILLKGQKRRKKNPICLIFEMRLIEMDNRLETTTR